MDELLTISASRMAEMIRKGEISSRQAVEAHIAHIEKVNPPLNAVVAKRYDEARSEADRADALLKEMGPENLPPFHGVPCSIKENFALTGMPNASGLVARKGIVSRSDAPCVERLRKAGAIPMGVTNTSELCMWMESNNKVYGRTGSAYDPKRTCGGSSGGEGSIIGAGGSPFGLGSDIGGSIRMPCFFNGIFGHKPTAGLIPNTGQIPLAEKGVSGTCTTGPLCRRAEDLWPLIKILAGPDGIDPGCVEIPLGDPSAVKISELKVTSVPENGRAAVDPELGAAQAKAAAALARLGCDFTEKRVERLKKSFPIWTAKVSVKGTTPFGTLLGNGKPINPAKELALYALGKSAHTLPALALAAVEKIPVPVARWLKEGDLLREELTSLIGKNGVMLFPSYSQPAPKHNAPLFHFDHWLYTGIINAMGFPSTQVPLGLSKNGLPLGVQVISLPGNDHVTVAVALELERIFGGWVPPWTAKK